jgi:putative transposase
MTRSRYRALTPGVPHFLTCTVVGWQPIFTRPAVVEIVFDSWRFLGREGRLEIHGYVILENHLHLVASAADLAKEIGDFKSYTARRILDALRAAQARQLLSLLRWHKERHKTDRELQLWQEGSHFQEIHDSRMMRQKLEYMHQNPVQRGYVEEPTHWRYSSARNYAGLVGLFPVKTDWA